MLKTFIILFAVLSACLVEAHTSRRFPNDDQEIVCTKEACGPNCGGDCCCLVPKQLAIKQQTIAARQERNWTVLLYDI
ncbi:hypothetical protein RR48_01437 [Papilio machaon]|uniref:Uncharacterized protein n=1 Tax=Papilio machaon TaxID=76193 RepID=A0A0N1IIV1_PAPMA|nr:hypothetical protein RR48_01437 [Papilio machaon]